MADRSARLTWIKVFAIVSLSTPSFAVLEPMFKPENTDMNSWYYKHGLWKNRIPEGANWADIDEHTPDRTVHHETLKEAGITPAGRALVDKTASVTKGGVNVPSPNNPVAKAKLDQFYHKDDMYENQVRPRMNFLDPKQAMSGTRNAEMANILSRAGIGSGNRPAPDRKVASHSRIGEFRGMALHDPAIETPFTNWDIKDHRSLRWTKSSNDLHDMPAKMALPKDLYENQLIKTNHDPKFTKRKDQLLPDKPYGTEYEPVTSTAKTTGSSRIDRKKLQEHMDLNTQHGATVPSLLQRTTADQRRILRSNTLLAHFDRRSPGHGQFELTPFRQVGSLGKMTDIPGVKLAQPHDKLPGVERRRALPPIGDDPVYKSPFKQGDTIDVLNKREKDENAAAAKKAVDADRARRESISHGHARDSKERLDQLYRDYQADPAAYPRPRVNTGRDPIKARLDQLHDDYNRNPDLHPIVQPSRGGASSSRGPRWGDAPPHDVDLPGPSNARASGQRQQQQQKREPSPEPQPQRRAQSNVKYGDSGHDGSKERSRLQKKLEERQKAKIAQGMAGASLGASAGASASRLPPPGGQEGNKGKGKKGR